MELQITLAHARPDSARVFSYHRKISDLRKLRKPRNLNQSFQNRDALVCAHVIILEGPAKKKPLMFGNPPCTLNLGCGLAHHPSVCTNTMKGVPARQLQPQHHRIPYHPQTKTPPPQDAGKKLKKIINDTLFLLRPYVLAGAA